MKASFLCLSLIVLLSISSCNKSPVASFTASSKSVEVGEVISFQSTSINATSLKWDFGDGNESTESNPQHSYSAIGDYTVVLTAYGKGSSDAASKKITVTPSYPCWSQLKQLPPDRNGYTVVLSDEKIYLTGSREWDKDLFVYDFNTNTWQQKADMLTSRMFLSGCAVNGDVYFIGGIQANDSAVANVEMYDFGTDSWTVKAQMPTKRWGHYTTEINGMIYVIGGYPKWPPNNAYNSVEVYNPSTNTWATLPPVGAGGPTPRWAYGACTHDDKIFIVGGTDAGHTPPGQEVPALAMVEEYDIALNTWTQKASLLTPRAGLICETSSGKIYALGGTAEFDPVHFRSVIEEYDPNADTWIQKGTMPIDFFGAGVCARNNNIYIPGFSGVTSNLRYMDFYVYDPGCDTIVRLKP